MNEAEALTRVKTRNFNSGCGFDMQLLVDAVGTIGEMLKSGKIGEIIRCKDCKYCKYPKSEYWCEQGGHLHGNTETWFCADGERR